MDFVRYFIESNVPFGGVSGTMMFVWALSLTVGIYLLRSYRDSNTARLGFIRQAGLVTAVLSGVGLVLLLLKLLGVPFLNIRLWGWLVALVWLGYLAYAVYVYNTKLPAQIAAARPSRVVRGVPGRGGSKVYTAPTTATPRPPREPRPLATTTRREARRDKKRKGR